MGARPGNLRSEGMAEMTPETVVRDQIDEYNGHDVADFPSYYARDSITEPAGIRASNHGNTRRPPVPTTRRRVAQGPTPESVSGGVAEWTNAAVLKTAVGQPTVGSNPTPSATARRKKHQAVIARPPFQLGD